MTAETDKEKEREAWVKVISLFKDLSYLYDKKHSQYFDRDKRQEAYKMLLQVFNEEFGKEIMLAEFKKKFENMRANYGKELKKVKASKQTGAGSNDLYMPTLWYFSLFEFLEGTTEPCRTGIDTLYETQNSSSTLAFSPDSETSPKSPQRPNEEASAALTKTSPRKRRTTLTLQKKQEKLLNSAEIMMSQKEDDWEIIGKSIGLQIKALNTRQQAIAQKIISDALFYGKINKLTDHINSYTTTTHHTILSSSCTPQPSTLSSLFLRFFDYQSISSNISTIHSATISTIYDATISPTI